MGPEETLIPIWILRSKVECPRGQRMLAVSSPVNGEANAVGVRVDGNGDMAARDGEFLPEHIVATVASPEGGVIGAGYQLIARGVEPKGPVSVCGEVTGDRILGTGDHQVTDSVDAGTQVETERRSEVPAGW